MPRDVAVNCTVSVAGIIVPANIQGTGPDTTRGVRPIILALGLPNNLVGYAPSTSAKSGFKVTFDLPYAVSGANLNAMLLNTGVTVDIQFGAAGGASVANCFYTTFGVAGSQGGNIVVTIAYDSNSIPTIGTAVAPPPASLDVYKFNDVTSYQAVSGTIYTDVSQIAFDLKQNIAKYVGNSTTGVPKYQQGTHVEASTMGEYLKVNDAEQQAWLGGGAPNYCPTLADTAVVLNQICPPGGAAAGVTFTAHNCFYDAWPTSNVPTEDFISEKVTAMASQGGFSIV